MCCIAGEEGRRASAAEDQREEGATRARASEQASESESAREREGEGKRERARERQRERGLCAGGRAAAAMSDSRYYRVDEGGLVGFRRTPQLSDQADTRRFPAAGRSCWGVRDFD